MTITTSHAPHRLITTAEQIEALPLGAILVHRHTDRPNQHYLRTKGGVRSYIESLLHADEILDDAPFEVAFLPDPTADGRRYGVRSVATRVSRYYGTNQARAVFAALTHNAIYPNNPVEVIYDDGPNGEVVYQLPTAGEDPRLAEETDQLGFDDVLPAAYDTPTPAPGTDDEPTTIQERFEKFHAENPWIYHRLRHLALTWLERGHDKVSIGMLFEVLRWQAGVDTRTGHGEPALNNSHRSRYARLLAANEPALADAFETRTLRSE